MNLFDECHRLFSYDAETGLLTRKVAILDVWGNPNPMPKCKMGDVVGSNVGKGHLAVNVYGRLHKIHRVIWLMVTGDLPKEQIDHINGNGSDNRWVNLREATNAENCRNRGKNVNNKTGFKGVSYSGKKTNPYRALIGFNGKLIHLGLFPTAELAHEAYWNKAKELHGKFAKQHGKGEHL